ncbi:hypothetical protein ACIB24_19220 [Spongisporangium articulatum]|uniref:Uncharacterized protein n=1 Tax=Spongisporangium articulatum TaxID=3362603 RepID=A0ABW8AS54_9ACTN
MSSEAPESGLSAGTPPTPAPGGVPNQAAAPVVPVIAGSADTPALGEQAGPKRRTGMHPLRLLLAVSAVVLALALGLVNQTSGEASLALRVPALLAAMVLFGQGVLDMWRGLPHRWSFRSGVTPSVAETPPVAEAGPAWLLPLFLGVWLGCADLVVGSTSPLKELAVVAAFVLFAYGWMQRPAMTPPAA